MPSKYDCVFYNISNASGEPLPPLPDNMYKKVLVLQGNVSVWQYAAVMDKVLSLHGNGARQDIIDPPAAIAVQDCSSDNKATVVHSATSDYPVGQTINIGE